MELFVASVIITGLAIAGMAIGLITNGQAIKGSCGGLGNIPGLESACDACADKDDCLHERQNTAR